MAAMGMFEALWLLFFGAFLPNDMEPLPAEQVLWGMPADCELMLFTDLRGIDTTITEGMELLSRQPWVMSNADLAGALTELNTEYARSQTELSTMLGFNPFTDLTAGALCGRLGTSPRGEPFPEFLVVIQGAFDAALAERVAGMIDLTPMPLENGAAIFGTTEDGMIIGMAGPADGVLLFGTESYLAPLAVAMPAVALPTAPEGSLLARLTELVPYGATSFAALKPSIATRFLMSSEGPVSFAQLVAGLDSAYMLSNASTSYFEVRANDAGAHANYNLIMSGIGELATAAPHVTNGMLQLMFGVLSPDDPDLDDELRSFVRHRDDIFALIGELGLTEPAEVELGGDPASFVTSLTMNNAASMQATGAFFVFGVAAFVGFSRASYDYYDDPYYAPTPPTPVTPY